MKKISTTQLGFNKTNFGSRIEAEALAAAKSSNEGGIASNQNSAMPQVSDVPRLVTRGESISDTHYQDECESYEVFVRGGKPVVITTSLPLQDIEPQAAIVDYLNCSFNFEKISLQVFFSNLLPILGYSFAPAIDRQKGIYGYTHSFQLGQSAGIFAYGGNRGTGFLSLSGECCHRIADWPRLVDFLSINLGAHITRWDGAYDDFQGIHSVDNALRMYKEGLFSTGGRKPLMDQAGNWDEPDGRGRTLYIGSSENGKMARIYEKGMQLKIPFHPWVRWEVQLGNRDRIIPWEAVLTPGNYLAGSYINALSWISEVQTRIRTLKTTSSLGYESLNHWLKVGWGKHINAMMIKEGSAEKVISMIIREGLPARLDLPILPKYGRVLP